MTSPPMKLDVLKARLFSLETDIQNMDWNEWIGLGEVLDAVQLAYKLADRVRPLTDEERSFYAKQRKLAYDDADREG